MPTPSVALPCPVEPLVPLAVNDLDENSSALSAELSAGLSAECHDVSSAALSSGMPPPAHQLDAAGDAGALVLEERFSIVPEWVLDADISDAAVRLYAVLLRYGQSSGQRMPSRRTLAGRLRKSVDSVDRALKELVALGAVEVTRRFRDGLNLTNRYLVRVTRRPSGMPVSAAGERGMGGRTAAATPDIGPDVGPGAVTRRGCEARRGGRGGRAGGRAGAAWGGRRGAAGGSRTGAAGVAARLRPDPEFFTQTNPPPHPSSTPPHDAGRGTDRDTGPGTGGGCDREAAPGRLGPVVAGGAGGEAAARRSRVLAALGLDASGLGEVADRCARLRGELGLPAGLWTPGRLVEVLADAVLDRGLPAGGAVAALLAVAADAATRSPARLSCPGPWWDTTAGPAGRAGQSGRLDGWGDGRVDGAGLETDVNDLEAVLAEAGGLRVVVQRQARAQLSAEGLPVTRTTVARRAVSLLENRPDAHDGSRP